MIEEYCIMHRSSKFIIRMFLSVIIFLTGLAIWGINTFYYQSFSLFHSQILFNNSSYFLEVLIPVKEVNQIGKQNQLWIGKNQYTYKVIGQSNHVIYKNGVNYLKVDLMVDQLDKEIQFDGYRAIIKIPKKNQKIIKYFMNKKEDNS
jgi:hypothetical protein